MSFVQVLRRLLNLGSSGAELWALYQAAETCRHCLSTEVNINSDKHDLMIGWSQPKWMSILINMTNDWLISGCSRSCLWPDSCQDVVRGDPSLPSCCVLGQLSKTGVWLFSHWFRFTLYSTICVLLDNLLLPFETVGELKPYYGGDVRNHYRLPCQAGHGVPGQPKGEHWGAHCWLLLYKTTLMILDTEQLRFARATFLVCGVWGILPVFPLARRRG